MTTRNNGALDVRRLYWEIGFRIKVAREARGLSQEALAKRIGITRVAVTNIELARYHTPLDRIYQIAQALDVPVARLLPGLREVEP